MRVAQHALRDAVGDRLPGRAVVGGLVDERIAVVHLVEVHREVARCRRRSATARCCRTVPHGGRPGMFFVTLVQVLPPSRVSCTRPSLVPAQISPRSRGDSAIAVDDAPYSTPMLSGVRPPEMLLPRLVVQRQVGADHLPALAAVGRAVHVLAADVDRVADRAARCGAARPRRSGTSDRPAGRSCCRPDLDVARLPPALVVAHDDAADAAGAGRGRPDDVRSRPDRAWPSRSRRRRPSATCRAECRADRRSRRLHRRLLLGPRYDGPSCLLP